MPNPKIQTLTEILLLLGIAGLFIFKIVGSLPAEEIRPAALNFSDRRLRASAPLDLRAAEYSVKILGDRFPVLKKNDEERVAPASLTKILTSVLALEKLPEDYQIKFSADDKKAPEHLSDAGIGEILARNDVIKLAMIGSNNDAALALAENTGKLEGGSDFQKSLEIFRDLMNQKARELGLANSHFENSTGLDGLNHYSSAADLSKLAEYVWNNHPFIWEISRMTEAIVYSSDQKPHAVKTTNDLLKEFPAILGGKTGFTRRSDGVLILLYETKKAGPRPVIIVILGSADRFGDARKIIGWLEKNFD